MLVIIVISAQDNLFFLKWEWIQNSYAIGLGPGFSILFCFVGMAFVDSFIVPVRYSEHWKAAWMLKLTPFTASSDLWRGVQATALFYLVTPCTFLMLCLATVIWGVSGIFYVLPGFIVLLNYVILYPKSKSGLPLAEELIQKRTTAVWIPFLCNLLAIGVFVGVQFLTYLINVQLYFVTYCIMVVAGIINFVYFWTRR